MKNFTISGAERAIACPGSLQLEPRFPVHYEPNQTQLEGKTADWCILKLANGEAIAPDAQPFGVPVTPDIVEDCKDYLQFLRDLLAQYGETLNPHCLESNIDLKWLTEDRKDLPTVTGRADFKHFIASHATMLVVDHKYGHRPVAAENNNQLAGAVLDSGSRRQTQFARCFIYQPRDFSGDGPVKEWRMTQDDIKLWAQHYRVARCQSVKPDAPLNTGTHCYGCNAAGGCPALQEDVEMAKTVLDAPDALSAEQVGERLTVALELTEKAGYLKDTLNAQALHMAKNGESVTGHKIVRSLTKRRVKDADALIECAPLYGLSEDDVTERKPLALGKLEKAFGKELLNVFTTKPDGRLEMAPESDNRPAAINNNPADVFNTPAVMPNTGE